MSVITIIKDLLDADYWHLYSNNEFIATIHESAMQNLLGLSQTEDKIIFNTKAGVPLTVTVNGTLSVD